ncbi:hypothetical protein [Actinoplanes sp. GCM10030250]|uniref:hypothetical protein n=1 Tax=Actinoplanes sp. GCM10030250 TaxID=3273376 RepID=UPI003616C27E
MPNVASSASRKAATLLTRACRKVAAGITLILAIACSFSGAIGVILLVVSSPYLYYKSAERDAGTADLLFRGDAERFERSQAPQSDMGVIFHRIMLIGVLALAIAVALWLLLRVVDRPSARQPLEPDPARERQGGESRREDPSPW